MLLRSLGILIASILTALAITGVVLLIAQDFPGVTKSLGDFWDEVTTPAPPSPANPFEGVEAITFFIKSEVAGTDVVVATGAEFSSGENIENHKPEHLWCYISFGGGSVSNRIDLGTRFGDSPPTYATLSGVSEADLNAIGLSRSQLRRVARSHCKFSNFDPKNANS